MTARPRRRKRAERVERLGKRPSFMLRRRVLVGALGMLFLAVIASAFERQVMEKDFLRNEGERRHLRVCEIPARRGMISDRNGEPLAVSTPVATVWGDPRRLVEQPRMVRALAGALKVNGTKLMARLTAKRERAFLYLKRRIGPKETAAVKQVLEKHRLRGVGLESEYRRFYPSGEIFGHVIGFTDVDDRGIEGMELAYDSWLRAEPGKRRVIQDGRRRVVAEIERIKPPRHGRHLILSIDRRLQFLAYRELVRAVDKHRAVAASAVVLDVETGEVLAMVNQPAYNPNAKLSGRESARRNRALTDVMEPGSTVKPLVVAAALEAGLVGPRTPIDTNPGTLRVGPDMVRDIRNYGRLDTTGVITKSSNVGVVKLALRMRKAALWRLYDRLGFGRATGVKFPGETPGQLRHFRDWRPFEHATLAFGYGLSVTTLQLAQAYGVLAADGIKRPLSLLKLPEPPAAERILSATTARRVRTMLETVVSAKGTARLAAIEGYRVAGKTGTAKKAVRGGYSARRYQSVFAGMAPASRPRFVMVVMIDEPRGRHYYGGKVAAPVFAKVMEGALRLFNVPPDNPDATLLLAGVGDRR
ncbi:peptidoglycan D,D-transpeptidase FtsI family protein [Candidatus Thiosymbion oneisti]|uniref:peptidoglycan D,D-transpeptidase FtsI family protein n=1 Tax=Candidatus Thiosymbion oneisti TaxID=589554 RepID=UPI000AB4CC1B|nr:penicillin-binding transpeptidase domain-containing protein [Candidatus Thiosymbion oneisti]